MKSLFWEIAILRYILPIAFAFIGLSTFSNSMFGQTVADLPVAGSVVTSETESLADDVFALSSAGESISVLPLADCSPEVCKPFEPTVKMTGFFQMDMGFYGQDSANRLTLGDIADSLGFRRTRLAAKGNVTENTSYIIEFDIAQSQARFVDVFMQINKTRFGNLRIGRFRQPFGMSDLTSVRELPFLERPLTFAEGPFRHSGVMLFDASEDERRTWAVSGYRYISDNFGNVYSDTGGYGLATRLTCLPMTWDDDKHFHLGADYSYNRPGRGVVQIAYFNEYFGGQNPNLGPTSLSVLPIVGVPPFVNTGQVNADSAQFFNLESALAMGRMAIQAETRWARVQRSGGGTATFPGAYVHLRYMLTGETIPYVKANGTFGRIKPTHPVSARCGEIGAWEIAGRVSHIDLNSAGINGRRLTNYTAGVNWYLNDFSKLQFNYINSQLDDVTVGGSMASTFAVRAQLDF